MTWESTLLPALAIIASVVVAVASMRFQRRLTEDGRLWERRATLYVDLLQHQYPYLASPHMDPEERVYFGAQNSEERELLNSLTARSDAFASTAVREQWGVTMLAVLARSSYVSEGMSNPMQPTPEEELHMAPLAEAERSAYERLQALIRTELRTDRRRARGLRRRTAEPPELD
ncbi:hypothetical protein ABZ905_25705 [Streptomyces parvus]|uniref:hypothetical protein n=1 Tax=Streptomyces parvus TaxID=66428 RepID=UPI0033FB24BE